MNVSRNVRQGRHVISQALLWSNAGVAQVFNPRHITRFSRRAQQEDRIALYQLQK
jgi:hypothetical protein